jgi:SAM-dependent methyltransferase
VSQQREGGTAPDYYVTVAEDVLRLCRPRHGVWVDLGAGSGGLGLALAATSSATLVLVDPKAAALAEALRAARDRGLRQRVVAVVSPAEAMPLADASVDLVVSRGSIFFWRDPAAGVREAYRILRRGGKAMVGGGLGSDYPAWARTEFTRRLYEGVQKEGPEALHRFRELRSPETFRRWAGEAGLTAFHVAGEDPLVGLGIWLRFGKEDSGS